MRTEGASSRDHTRSVAAGVVDESDGFAVEIRDGDESAQIVVCESHGVFLGSAREHVIFDLIEGSLS